MHKRSATADESRKAVWMALGELSDHFSRLGGSNRPRSMMGSDIHLFILTRLFESHNWSLPTDLYPSEDFVAAASPVLARAISYLSEINLEKRQLAEFAAEYYSTYNQKIPLDEKTREWERLGIFLSDIKA